MIVDQRLVTYINSLDKGNTPFLNELEMKALRDYVPIIRRETQRSSEDASAAQKALQDPGGGDCGRFFRTPYVHLRTGRLSDHD